MILRGHVFSKMLEMDTGITIVVPNNFSKKTPWKTAYLLHGICGNNASIVDYTMLPAYANKYHCIFIMPEAGRSFYTDMVYGQKYFSYVSGELPRICKNVFNISSKADDTFVMGFSMGGYGALKCAFTRPNQYKACCALAPGPLFLKDFLAELNEYGNTREYIARWGRQFINDLRSAFGERFTWKPEAELLYLAEKMRDAPSYPEIYVSCGTEDSLLDYNRRFNDEMKQLSIGINYEEFSGNHDWYFFDEALKRALDFCFPESAPAAPAGQVNPETK